MDLSKILNGPTIYYHLQVNKTFHKRVLIELLNDLLLKTTVKGFHYVTSFFLLYFPTIISPFPYQNKHGKLLIEYSFICLGDIYVPHHFCRF